MKNLEKTIIKETRLLERFLDYVKTDTQSDPNSTTFPSTEIQKNLGVKLLAELKDLGADFAEMDENGYVYAHFNSNDKKKTTKVAFLAHMDVAPDCKGNGVNPQIVENYDGNPINLKSGIVIDPENSPELLKCKGETIITSDGTTLLGADDKSGIATIMSMLEYLKNNPEIKHPNIRICFTPDEEVGKGVDFINMKKVDADFGYTVDGGFPFELNFENFYAFSCDIKVKGVNIHPGYAKNKMANAVRAVGKIMHLIKRELSPENTEGREGFIHPISISGNVEEANASLILRSFSMEEMENLKREVHYAVYLTRREARDEGQNVDIDVEFKESYKNMYEIMKDNMFVIDYVKDALKEMGHEADISPIRGGTDGARLSFMGLPCPNIFAGGVNFHSQKEWVSLEKMGIVTALLVTLAEKID